MSKEISDDAYASIYKWHHRSGKPFNVQIKEKSRDEDGIPCYYVAHYQDFDTPDECFSFAQSLGVNFYVVEDDSAEFEWGGVIYPAKSDERE